MSTAITIDFITLTMIWVMALLALLFSICTVLFSIKAYSKVVGLENSTHQIQYMPAEEFGTTFNQENPDEIIDEEVVERKRQEEMLKNFNQIYENDEE